MSVRNLLSLFVVFSLSAPLFPLGCAGGAKERAEPVLVRREAEAPRDTLVAVKAPEGTAITPTGRIRLDLPKPGFRGDPGTFTWKHFPGATGYRFVLLDRNQTVLFTGERVSENLIEIPAGAEAVLEPEGLFLWQVLAFDEKGDKIAESPFRDFIYLP